MSYNFDSHVGFTPQFSIPWYQALTYKFSAFLKRQQVRHAFAADQKKADERIQFIQNMSDAEWKRFIGL